MSVRSSAQFQAREAIELNAKKQPNKGTLDSIVNEHSRKSEFTYDANGNKTLEMSYEWDSELNQWKKAKLGKKEYTYNAGGKPVSYIEYEWDEALSQWKKFAKYDYAYNAAGNLVTKTLFYFIDKSWSLEDRDAYSYDTNGNITSWRQEFYQRGEWLYDKRENYNYDANGNIVSGVFYSFDENSKELIEHEKFTATYNSNGNITSLLTYNNWIDGSFQKDYKYEYTYNANGNIASLLTYWPDNNEWTTPSRAIYYYSGQTATTKTSTYYFAHMSNPDKTKDYLFYFFPDKIEYGTASDSTKYTRIGTVVMNKANQGLEWDDYKVRILLKSGQLVSNYKTAAKDGLFACNYTVEKGVNHTQFYCFHTQFSLDDINKVWLVLNDEKVFELTKDEDED